MPLGPVGCHVLIHAKPATWQLWDFRAKPGFYIGPALNSYRCFKLVKSDTKSQVILDTIKFCHLYLSVPVPSTKEKIIHGLQVIAGTIRGAPPPTSVSQLKAITSLQEIFESWRALAPPSLRPTHRPAPSPSRVNSRKPQRVVATSAPSPGPSPKSRPHMVSQHSNEAPTTASHDLMHSFGVCPYTACHPSLACIWQ
jgi:hypothetical protein